MQRLNEESPETLIVSPMIEGGWVEGVAHAYDSSYALDLGHLAGFIESTRPQLAAQRSRSSVVGSETGAGAVTRVVSESQCRGRVRDHGRVMTPTC